MGTPAAISAAVLAVLLWFFSRRRAALMDHQGTAVRAAQRQSSTSFVQPATPAAHLPDPAMGGDALGRGDLQRSRAAQPLGRRQRLQRLAGELNASRVQRLAAVDQMVGWGDRAVVPLLQRALRDPHPEVVVAAAAAMARFRGRSAAAAPGVVLSPSAARRPRNASPRFQSV